MHHSSPSYLLYFGTVRHGHCPAIVLHFSLCVAPTNFPYRIVNPIRRFRRLFQAARFSSSVSFSESVCMIFRRHIDPSQSFQCLDHQARHVRQTGDFLVGPMLKFQLCGVPLIGLIRAVADIGQTAVTCVESPKRFRAVFPHGTMVQW